MIKTKSAHLEGPQNWQIVFLRSKYLIATQRKLQPSTAVRHNFKIQRYFVPFQVVLPRHSIAREVPGHMLNSSSMIHKREITMWRNSLSVWFFMQHERWAFYIYTRNTYLVTQVKPCRSGLRTGWVTNREYRLKVHTLFFLFFFFFAYILCGVTVTVYWKADLALFRRPDLEKKKTKTKNKYIPVQFAWKLLFFGP